MAMAVSPVWRSCAVSLLVFLSCPGVTSSFTTSSSIAHKRSFHSRKLVSARHSELCERANGASSLDIFKGDNGSGAVTEQGILKFVASTALAITTASALLGFSGMALADEFGKETEAPTFFTGESVMICKKRGPLGACQETVMRTPENDNDKASKYFKDPSQAVKDKDAAMRASDSTEGNALIQKLRQQSADNKEKNDLLVQQKMFENDQSATFGPFDRQVVIMNTDGRTFTLLNSPQAMRLKKAGYIKDRKFIKQPTEEVIEQALESPDFGDTIKGFFGGGEK